MFVGAALLLFSWLVLPFLVLLGYGADIGRSVATGSEDLPRFRIGQAADGFRAIVVMIGYLLPILLLFLPSMLIGAALEEQAPPAPVFALFFLGYVGIVAYGLAISLLQPAIFAVFIAEGRVGACFQPSLLKAVIKPRGLSYLAVAAVLIGVSQLVGIGFLIFIVGILFTAFYFLVLYAHYAGQLARPLTLPASPDSQAKAGSDPSLGQL
jgi:hypothetical protein